MAVGAKGDETVLSVGLNVMEKGRWKGIEGQWSLREIVLIFLLQTKHSMPISE